MNSQVRIKNDTAKDFARRIFNITKQNQKGSFV